MNDTVNALIDAIERRDADAIRAAYAPGARLVTMTPNTFLVADDPDGIVGRLVEWYLSWEEDPHFAFLGTVRDGNRVAVEFERTSTFEGDPWVVRQAHLIELANGLIVEHRIYCCGPRKGAGDLAALYAGSAS